jgi:hypothetical protein
MYIGIMDLHEGQISVHSDGEGRGTFIHVLTDK